VSRQVQITPGLLGLLIGGSLIGSLVGCSEKQLPLPPPPQVVLVTPRPEINPDSADYQSTLEAIREVRLAPEIAGRMRLYLGPRCLRHRRRQRLASALKGGFPSSLMI